MRLPRAADLGAANLRGAGGAAQLNLGVAKETGAAAAALGNAISSAAGSISKIAGMIDKAQSSSQDAFALPEAKLAFDQRMFEAENGLYNSAGEDGAGLKAYPEVAREVALGVEKDFGGRFNDEDRARFGIYTGRQTLEGTKRAYNTWQGKAQEYASGKESSLIQGRFIHLDQSGGWGNDEAYNSALKSSIETVERSVGQTRTQEQAAQRIDEIKGQFTLQRLDWLNKNDPDAAKVLLDKIQKGVVDENPASPEQPPSREGGLPKRVQNSSFNIFEGRTPSPSERRAIFRKGGVVVNLDTNWSKGDRPTSPMVVIPDNATAEQRQQANAYAKGIAGVYEKQFGVKLTPKVVTRSQNGRGRSATIHTEPYAVTDSRAVEYFKSPEGVRVHANILRETLGKIPGVQFSLPHDPYGNGDRGAEANGVNEVELAGLVLEDLKSGGEAQADATPQLQGEPELVRVAEYKPTSGTMTDALPDSVPQQPGEGGEDPIIAPQAGVSLDMSGGKGTMALPTQLVEQLAVVAQENPEAPVGDYLSDAQKATIAQTGLIDPDETTVAQMLQLAQVAQQEGLLNLERKQEAIGQPQESEALSSGRLLKGQTFSVKVGGQSFSITAEQWNSLSAKQRQGFRKSMNERLAVVRKEQVYAADHMMKTQLATVERTGQGAEKFDPKFVARVFRDDPQKIAKFNDQLKVSQYSFEATKGVWDLPDDQLDQRRDELEERMFDADGDVDPDISKVYERTQRKLDKVIQLRRTDPAKAVENTKEVQSFIRQWMPNGANEASKLYGLADARIQAQIRLGLEPTPLTKREAVRMLEPFVRAGSFEEKKRLSRELVTNLREVYQEHAEVVLNSALFLNSRETEDDRLTLAQTMRTLEREAQAQKPSERSGRQDRLKVNPYDQFHR